MAYLGYGQYWNNERHQTVFAEVPRPSLPGILIASASIIVMPLLFCRKHKADKQINSKALIADSKETLACIFLSIALLLTWAPTTFLVSGTPTP